MFQKTDFRSGFLMHGESVEDLLKGGGNAFLKF